MYGSKSRSRRSYRSSRPSEGLKSFFKGDGPVKATIYNLDKDVSNKGNLDKAYYNKFKQFLDGVITKVSDQLDSLTGNIIDVFEFEGIDEKDKAKLEQLKTTYEGIYLKNTTTEQRYPYYLRDMFAKKAVAFELFENKYFSGKPEEFESFIQKQTNAEFLETLKKRIEGLSKCSKDSDVSITDSARQYYKSELEREGQLLEKLTGLSDEYKISKLCDSILYGEKTYNETMEIINTDEKKKII